MGRRQQTFIIQEGIRTEVKKPRKSRKAPTSFAVHTDQEPVRDIILADDIPPSEPVLTNGGPLAPLGPDDSTKGEVALSEPAPCVLGSSELAPPECPYKIGDSVSCPQGRGKVVWIVPPMWNPDRHQWRPRKVHILIGATKYGYAADEVKPI
jgi:hypothetical protein